MAFSGGPGWYETQGTPGTPGTHRKPAGGQSKAFRAALVGALAVAVLLGVIGLLARDDGTETASATSGSRANRNDRPSSATSLLPSTVPLTPATNPTATTGSVLERPPTLPEVQSALLTATDIGPSYQTVAYGTDEPYCGQPVVITSQLRANTAFEVVDGTTSGVRIDNDVQSYADAGGAAAILDGARSLVANCAFSTTVVNGVEYTLAVTPFETPTQCDDSEVFLQVAAPSSLAGPTVTRAVGLARCGRNLTSVGVAVIGREFTTGDEVLFNDLFATAVNRLAAIPQ